MQRDAGNEIPILELWGRLVVPLQGDITDTQMEALQERVLRRVRARAPSGLVLDATGVWMMDSHLCAVMGRLASAARLMGTRPVLSGLSPTIVMTLQTMGIELTSVETTVSLEAALELLGVWPDEDDDEEETDDER
ncbi:MAG: STAS domain-containing protein [Myxococcales bacterium]|nr:STAS domain-containing protein [Myxococcales bacterium]